MKNLFLTSVLLFNFVSIANGTEATKQNFNRKNLIPVAIGAAVVTTSAYYLSPFAKSAVAEKKVYTGLRANRDLEEEIDDCKCIKASENEQYCQEWTCEERTTCLPLSSYALVETIDADGNRIEQAVKLADLKKGDRILSSVRDGRVFSPVKYISHLGDETTEFVSLTTDSGSVLSTTPVHRIFIKENGKIRDEKAGKIDKILNSDSYPSYELVGEDGAKIVSSTRESKAGFINVVTDLGTIVVSESTSSEDFLGFEVSCYSVVPHPWAHLAYQAHYYLTDGKTQYGLDSGTWWEKQLESIAIDLEAKGYFDKQEKEF